MGMVRQGRRGLEIRAELGMADRQREARLEGRTMRRLEPAGHVYFVESLPSRAIKIGWATDVLKRMETAQVFSVERLRLVGVLLGSRDDERRIHERFAAQRIRGEWFRRSYDLSALMLVLHLWDEGDNRWAPEVGR